MNDQRHSPACVANIIEHREISAVLGIDNAIEIAEKLDIWLREAVPPSPDAAGVADPAFAGFRL